MAHDPDDAELARAFAALREADARRAAPDFGTAWSRAVGAASRRPRRVTRWVIGAAAIAAGTLLAVSLRQPVRSPVVDVVSWQSPTALLLRGPSDALLRDVPPLGQSSIPFFSNSTLPGAIP